MSTKHARRASAHRLRDALPQQGSRTGNNSRTTATPNSPWTNSLPHGKTSTSGHCGERCITDAPHETTRPNARGLHDPKAPANASAGRSQCVHIRQNEPQPHSAPTCHVVSRVLTQQYEPSQRVNLKRRAESEPARERTSNAYQQAAASTCLLPAMATSRSRRHPLEPAVPRAQ